MSADATAPPLPPVAAARLAGPDRLSLALLGAGALAVVGLLAQYWGLVPSYADRFLILVGAGLALRDCLPALRAAPARPEPWLGGAAVLVGGVAFALGLFLAAQIGPRTLLLWWLVGAWVVAAAGWLLARGGSGAVRAVLFPLLFPLLALPIPLRVLVPLQDALQGITTTCAERILRGVGYAVERSEYVLRLPGGLLRVEEACSGVRSLTAMLAIAAFVAFWQGFKPLRGLVLLALALPVVALINVLRVAASGVIQEEIGPEYIQGTYHEGLGFALIFVGLGATLLLAGLLERRGGAGRAVPVPEPAAVWAGWPRRGAGPVAGCVIVAGLLSALAGYGGQTTRGAVAESAPIGAVPLELPGWRGAEFPVPETVADLLAPDLAWQRRYESPLGQDCYAWAFYWGTGAAIKGYHHPDVCWRNKGYDSAGKWGEVVAFPGGGSAALTAREFRHGSEQQVVLYWTQEGGRVWTDDDERAAEREMLSSSWSGHRWVGDLIGAESSSQGPRLQVVVVVPAGGPRARAAGVDLARKIGEELYRACPWARPGVAGAGN